MLEYKKMRVSLWQFPPRPQINYAYHTIKTRVNSSDVSPWYHSVHVEGKHFATHALALCLAPKLGTSLCSRADIKVFCHTCVNIEHFTWHVLRESASLHSCLGAVFPSFYHICSKSLGFSCLFN